MRGKMFIPNFSKTAQKDDVTRGHAHVRRRQRIIRLILIADVIKKTVKYVTKEGKNITYLIKTSSRERERETEGERDIFFFELNVID